MTTESFNPSKLKNIDITNLNSFNKVGTDNNGWQNGQTPINAENLNKSDDALYQLLVEKTGYIYQIISLLNNESDVRFNEVKHLSETLDKLNGTLNSEILSRESGDSTLDDKINTEITNRTNSITPLISDISTLSTNVANLQSVDTQLGQALDAEISRSTQAEQTISNSIPTKVSQLSNDSEYVTETTLNSKNYVTETVLDSKKYVTEDSLGSKEYVTESSLESKKYVNEDTFNSAIVSDDQIIIYCGTSLDNMFD